MEQVQSQEYRQEIPSGVKVIAWIILVSTVLSMVVLSRLTLIARPGEVMFRYFGHEYLVAGEDTRAIGLAFLYTASSLSAAIAIFTLKGRMWAYYLLLVSSMWHTLSVTVGLFTWRVDLMAWLPFVVLWVLVKDYRPYRDFARSRTAPRT